MAGTTILKVSTVTMNFDVNVVSTGKKRLWMCCMWGVNCNLYYKGAA